MVKINQMEKLNKLIKLCKCGVHVSINQHRDYYETVESYFLDNPHLEGIDKDVYHKMIELNTVVEIQYYPRTPVCFEVVYHYDLETAINEAIESFNSEN